jgi:hypothetical protein
MGPLTILATVIFVAVALAMVSRFARAEGYYSTIPIFAVGCFVYYVAIPLDVAVRRIGGGGSPSSFAVSLSDKQLAGIVVMATLALVAWVVGYLASGFRPWPSPEDSPIHTEVSVPSSLFVLVLGALLVLLPWLFFGHLLQGLRDYASQGSRVVVDNPILAVLLAAVYIPLGVIGAIWLRDPRRRPAAIGIAITLSIASVIINRKEAISIAFLMLASPLTRWRLRLLPAVAILVVAVTVGLFVFNAYSLYRGKAQITVSKVLAPSYGLVEGSDAGGPFASMQYVFGGHAKTLYGQSYLDIATLMVPKAIWPGRPADLPERFAQATLPNWKPGQGTGFSLLAEAYLNLGVLGVFVQYLALGWAWGSIWKLIRRILVTYPDGAWQALYSTLGFFTLLTMHRGTVATAFKTFLVMAVPLIVASLVVDRGWRIYKERRDGRQRPMPAGERATTGS